MCNCNKNFSNNYNKPNVKVSSPVNDKSKILLLWKGVINNESRARVEFIRIYLQKFPQKKYLTEILSKENLHTMYVDLTR